MNIALLKNELWTYDQDKAVVDAQVQEQTAASLSLQEEIQRLEEQQVEDRVRIQRLLTLPQPVGPDVTIVTKGGALPTFPSFGGKTKAGGGGGSTRLATTQQQQEDTETDNDNDQSLPVEGSEDVYKKKQEEWVAKALRVEKDRRVALTLEKIQALNRDIARCKAGYEREVLELQRRRALREAEAAQTFTPLLDSAEDAVRRMEAHETEMASNVRSFLQLVLDAQSYKAALLNEHAALAQLRQQVAARVRTFHASLQKATQTVATEAEVAAAAEEEGAQLREELAAIEAEILDLNDCFEQAKPQMELKLAVLNATLEKSSQALLREKRRYRMDNEGYETDVRNLTKAVVKAKRLEEKLRVERAMEREERGGLEEEEGEVEEEEAQAQAEAEEDNLEELEDLMFQLELLLSKRQDMEK